MPTGGEIRASVGANIARKQRGENPAATVACQGAMHVFGSRTDLTCVCGERERPANDRIVGEQGEETVV